MSNFFRELSNLLDYVSFLQNERILNHMEHHYYRLRIPAVCFLHIHMSHLCQSVWTEIDLGALL